MRSVDKSKIRKKLKESDKYIKDFALELYDISDNNSNNQDYIELDFNNVKGWFFNVAIIAKYVEQTLFKMGNHGVSQAEVFTTINGAGINANKFIPIIKVNLTKDDKERLYKSHLSLVEGLTKIRKALVVFDGKKVSCDPCRLNEIGNICFQMTDDVFLAFS